MMVEAFLPNYYCKDCYGKDAEFKPDTPSSVITSQPSSVFYADTNGNRTLDQEEINDPQQSNKVHENFFTGGWCYGWDPARSPQVGDKNPDYYCLTMKQGGESHLAAYDQKWIQLNQS